MDSIVDTWSSLLPPPAICGDPVHLTQSVERSIGIAVCRLRSGQFRIGMRGEDDQHVMINATAEELRALVDQLDALLRSA